MRVRTGRRAAAVVAAALMLGQFGPTPALADPVAGGGVLLPQLWQDAPTHLEVQASPAYVAYQYDQPVVGTSPPLQIRRLSDGSLVRNVPWIRDPDVAPPVLDGGSWLQADPAAGMGYPGGMTEYDVETGHELGHLRVPASDIYLGAGAGWLLTARWRSADNQAEIHLIRSGLDVATGIITSPYASNDYLVGNDAQTALYNQGGNLWTIDVHTGATTHVVLVGPWQSAIVLGPTRVYWTEDEARINGVDVTHVHWWDRTTGEFGEAPGITTLVTDHFRAFGDGLAVLLPATEAPWDQYGLAQIDLTTGQVGAPLAGEVMAAAQTGDGRVVTSLADSAAGRVAVAGPDAPLRTVVDLPPIGVAMGSVQFSGNRIETARWYTDEVQVVPADGGGGWSTSLAPGDPALVNTPDAPTLGAALMAGDIVITQTGPSTGSTTPTRVSWPGGSRDLNSLYGVPRLGHGGQLLQQMVHRSNGTDGWELRDPRTGALLSTDATLDQDSQIDGTRVWHRSSAGHILGIDVSGAQPPRDVAVSASCGANGLTDVRGRWALLACGTTEYYVVDLGGALPTWRLPLVVGDRDPMISAAGFVTWSRYPTQGSPSLQVAELAATHRQRDYGLFWGSYYPGEGVAVDDAGSPRLAYLDLASQVRRLDLDWLGAVPPEVPAPPPAEPSDTTAPTLTQTSGTAALIGAVGPSTDITFGWTFHDPSVPDEPLSGLAVYDVRYRQQPVGATPGAWQSPAAWQGVSTDVVHLGAAPDTDTCFSARAHDNAGNVSDWSPPRCTEVDGSGVVITKASAGSRVVASISPSAVVFAYLGKDPAGIASYEVSYRKAAPGKPLGPWTTPSSWGTTMGASVAVQVKPGGDVCFRVRGHDAVGNVGAWSATACSAVPYTEFDFLPWGPITQKAKVLYTADKHAIDGGGVAVLEQKGAAIRHRNLTGRQIALWVIQGPGQGAVDVYVGKHKVGRVSLSAAKWRRVLVTLSATAKTWTGDVIIRSVTSSKARIDAVAVLR
jgi:hypothetical protein